MSSCNEAYELKLPNNVTVQLKCIKQEHQDFHMTMKFVEQDGTFTYICWGDAERNVYELTHKDWSKT